jgi:hypothetical protein
MPAFKESRILALGNHHATTSTMSDYVIRAPLHLRNGVSAIYFARWGGSGPPEGTSTTPDTRRALGCLFDYKVVVSRFRKQY